MLFVGYKIGYELKKDTYYSWLGGVSSEHRNQGIARTLMDHQHQYAHDKGYTWIETKTMNSWRNMLILNLRCEYNIVGTYLDRNNEMKIVLRKQLS